jgi:hypothetical protein
MQYRCRTTKPALSEWREVEASSPEQAANDFHERELFFVESVRLLQDQKDGGIHCIIFALIEVEGHGERLSRIYSYGIFRGGGVGRIRSLDERLKEVAQQVGWEKDPWLLIEPGWEGEETMDEARARKAM